MNNKEMNMYIGASLNLGMKVERQRILKNIKTESPQTEGDIFTIIEIFMVESCRCAVNLLKMNSDYKDGMDYEFDYSINDVDKYYNWSDDVNDYVFNSKAMNLIRNTAIKDNKISKALSTFANLLLIVENEFNKLSKELLACMDINEIASNLSNMGMDMPTDKIENAIINLLIEYNGIDGLVENGLIECIAE